ncbi:MAG: GNAT family N-acetyltransferase [Flavobacteriales bacterium]|nr:GNAT family N-acetyltransferase [Flavobacteriales bacterium]
MRIRFIKAEATYPLRLMVLRPGGVVEDTHFPNDRLEGAFHLAAQKDDQLISVASFYPEKNGALMGWKQYRLRGMATHPDFAGKGAGSLLIRFALEHLAAQHVDVVWCNARLHAIPFYKKVGFETLGGQFDLEGIGPHNLMHRRV